MIIEHGRRNHSRPRPLLLQKPDLRIHIQHQLNPDSGPYFLRVQILQTGLVIHNFNQKLPVRTAQIHPVNPPLQNKNSSSGKRIGQFSVSSKGLLQIGRLKVPLLQLVLKRIHCPLQNLLQAFYLIAAARRGIQNLVMVAARRLGKGLFCQRMPFLLGIFGPPDSFFLKELAEPLNALVKDRPGVPGFKGILLSLLKPQRIPKVLAKIALRRRFQPRNRALYSLLIQQLCRLFCDRDRAVMKKGRLPKLSGFLSCKKPVNCQEFPLLFALPQV